MKRILCILLAIVLVLSLVACGKKKAETKPTEPQQQETVPAWKTFPADRALTAQQYFVYDCETGEFVVNSCGDGERIYPASITKLFTAYVACQFLPADRLITAGDALDLVFPGSSVAELEKGDQLTVGQLVEAMMLPSGNDAAYVLAVEAGREIGGSSLPAQEAAGAFVTEMNRQAKALGMKDTHFANPDGIHQDSHYSSAHDLALMGALVLEDPLLMQYVGTANDTVSLTSGTKQWKNTNALIHPDSEY